jgi:hypothetical protein
MVKYWRILKKYWRVSTLINIKSIEGCSPNSIKISSIYCRTYFLNILSSNFSERTRAPKVHKFVDDFEIHVANSHSLSGVENCPISSRNHVFCLSCEITAFIAGNCMLCCFNSEFTKKINKITYKTDKNKTFLLFYWFCLWFYWFCLCYNNRAHSCQLIKAVFSHGKFSLCIIVRLL